MSDVTKSTPYHVKYNSVISSSLSGSLGTHLVEQYRAKVVDDMAHSAVPFTAEDFRELLLNIPNSISSQLPQRPSLAQNPFGELENATTMTEKAISEQLTAAINDHHLVPGLTASLCGNRPDPTGMDEDGQKIDSALYYEGAVLRDGRPYWADQVVPIEYKTHLSRRDPYDDKNDGLSTDTDDRKKVRGQIIHYAELIFAIQQRTSLFMILILGRKFRVLRWDRSGVAVSKAEDYFLNWDLFCDILWRISILATYAPHLLGVDPSATRIYPEDDRWKKMTEASHSRDTDLDHTERKLPADELPNGIPDDSTFKYVRQFFASSLHELWPRYELEVPNGKSVQKYLVCRPLFRAKGMAGRGTRGYVALNSETGQLGWLKDAWRVGYKDVEQEGAILAMLNKANVPNIPTLVCHGDIRGQETETPVYWEYMDDLSSSDPAPAPASDADNTAPHTSSSSSSQTAVSSSSSSKKRKRSDVEVEETNAPPELDDGTPDPDDRCPLRRHTHYRMVVKEVGMPLSSFQGGRQLVEIIADCVYAHYFASVHHKVLHRDISGGNIILYPMVERRTGGVRELRWAGILVDWELSKRMDDNQKRRQPERTGTWQYMSVALLTNADKVVTIPDDLESFLYILLYFAIRYLRSSMRNVGDFLEEFFDSYIVTDSGYGCGYLKDFTVREVGKSPAVPETKQRVQFSSPLDFLFRTLFESFHAYYKIIAYEEGKENVTPISDPSPADTLSAPEPQGEKFQFLYRMPGPPVPQVPKTSPPTEPTEKEVAASKNATDHTVLLRLLLAASSSSSWSANDKAGDRVPRDWTPKRAIGPTFVSTTTNSKHKRARTMLSFGAEAIMAQMQDTPSKAPSKVPRQTSQTGRKAKGT